MKQHPLETPDSSAAVPPERSITDWTKLGAAIRDTRVSSGITQADAAAKAGVARSWLARVEAGHRGAELGSLLKLFAALDLEMAIRPARHPPAGTRPSTRRELRQREQAHEQHSPADAEQDDA